MRPLSTRILRTVTTLALAAMASIGASHAAPVGGMGTWETTLQARDLDGNGSVDAYYDSTLDVTWLDASNRPKILSEQQAWVDALAPGSTQGWRLPNVRDTGDQGCDFSYSGTDCGWNVQTRIGDITFSELAHLFYVTLGNLGDYDTDGNQRPGLVDVDFGFVNSGPFQNIAAGQYFTGNQLPAPFEGYSRTFATSGLQFYRWDNDLTGAIALHEGDVGNAVPQPHGLALALVALGLTAASTRRRRQISAA